MKIALAPVFLAGLWSLVPITASMAQTPQQLLVSSSGSGVEYTQNVAAVNDGSSYLQVLIDTGTVFHKLDPGGIVQWSRYIMPLPALSSGRPPISATPDGGLVILFNQPYDQGNVNFDLVRLSAAGATVWAKRVSVPATSDFGTPMTMVVNDAGEIFISGKVQWSSAVLKLDANGDPLWCQRIWDMPLAAAMDQILSVEPTVDGGCMFLGSVWPSPFGGALSVGRLSPQGTVLWSKAYTYGSPNAILLDPDLTVDVDGFTTVSARLDLIGLSNNILTHRIDSSGNLLRSDLYSLGQGFLPALTSVHATGTNEIHLHATSSFQERSWLTQVDAQGVVQGSFLTDRDTVANTVTVATLWSIEARNGTLHLAGDMLEQDLLFGTEDRSTMLWRVSGSYANVCYQTAVTVQHNVVPVGVVSTANAGQSLILVAGTQPSTVQNVLLSAPLASSFCSAVSVNEQRAEPEWSLSPNPVTDELFLSGKGLSPRTTWTVMDAAGSIVKTGRLSGTTAGIPVETLVPGAYVLRIVNEHGTQAERFIKY